ncbi:MAG TPA: DUF4031 domain-containing protein [Frankiaceae bacterium]|nr:DUF4031 domain-containing protein [Frankiaceae bacterium]
MTSEGPASNGSVDDAVWPFRGDWWAHLVSDVSYLELHAFADQLGTPRRGFQGDHYDVPARVREQAVALGAQPVSSRELVRRLRAAGLRCAPTRDASSSPRPPRRC